jgi:hypothetical protein
VSRLFHAELSKSGRFIVRDLNGMSNSLLGSGCGGNTFEGMW